MDIAFQDAWYILKNFRNGRKNFLRAEIFVKDCKEAIKMLMIRDVSDYLNGILGVPLESKSGAKKIRDAGIDTNSKAYQVVISSMKNSAGNGIAYTNPQAVKNRMANYDANGNWINPAIQFGAKFNGKIFSEG
ncbi:MAG: DUF3879 family protein [Selenomonadaceae bacterium]|nr:DUF3879 family protein [Selenomonadaceae bacterium]